MNKHRFIERLNLHLDGELSEEESAELLSVIRENPEYHRIYVQYCQLFNACSELGNRFATPNPNVAWRQKLYAIGGMAAACALLLLATRNLTPLFDDIGGGGAQLMANAELPIQTNGGADEEAFLVDSSTRLEDFDSWSRFDNAFSIPVEFEEGIPHNFNLDSNVRYAHYMYAGQKKRAKILENRQFELEEAKDKSTLPHEYMIAEDIAGEIAPFEISSPGESAFGEDGKDTKVKYFLDGAANSGIPKD